MTSNLSDSFVVENTVSFVQKTDSRLRRSSVQGMARACGARHFHFFGVPLNAIFCPDCWREFLTNWTCGGSSPSRCESVIHLDVGQHYHIRCVGLKAPWVNSVKTKENSNLSLSRFFAFLNAKLMKRTGNDPGVVDVEGISWNSLVASPERSAVAWCILPVCRVRVAYTSM